MAFAFGPLAAAFELEFALGDIVHRAVAANVREGVCFVDVLGCLADDNSQFNFLISFR